MRCAQRSQHSEHHLIGAPETHRIGEIVGTFIPAVWLQHPILLLSTPTRGPQTLCCRTSSFSRRYLTVPALHTIIYSHIKAVLPWLQ